MFLKRCADVIVDELFMFRFKTKETSNAVEMSSVKSVSIFCYKRYTPKL